MSLKEYRKSLNITIEEASICTGVPVRTYFRYENDDAYGSPLKRKAIYDLLKEKYLITEEKGVLSIEQIKKSVTQVLDKYKKQISFCYLFGSYAKGCPSETSDVDLCISTEITGIYFLGIIEELRESLHKKVDLLRVSDLTNNIELVEEIMKEGIKIYG